MAIDAKGAGAVIMWIGGVCTGLGVATLNFPMIGLAAAVSLFGVAYVKRFVPDDHKQ